MGGEEMGGDARAEQGKAPPLSQSGPVHSQVTESQQVTKVLPAASFALGHRQGGECSH
jgi:hypothetical protein